MRDATFYIVDVFAETPCSGNQLAVFTDARGLDSERMQVLAREMNFSETTFIDPSPDPAGGYAVRIFTPTVEVPFAGHPTLGTAFVIGEYLRGGPWEKIRLNLGVGPIEVTAGDDGVLWMETRPPVFGDVFDAAAIADALGIEPDQIDSRYPLQAVSTGLPFILAPLKDLAAVKQARLSLDKLPTLADGATTHKAVLVFCRETYEPGNDINARMFGEGYGVMEDPATGSANSCLAGYLLKYGCYDLGAIDVCVEQGYEIGRKSLLYLRAVAAPEAIRVRVGGKVKSVAKATLLNETM